MTTIRVSPQERRRIRIQISGYDANGVYIGGMGRNINITDLPTSMELKDAMDDLKRIVENDVKTWAEEMNESKGAATS